MTFATRITLFRFGLAAIMVPVFYQGTEIGYFVTMLMFLMAVGTDILDGHVARRFDQISDLGAKLDALIDKALIYALLFSLFYVRIYSPFLLFPMFFRDMIVDGLRNTVNCSVPSNVWGKLKFSLQSVSVLLGLAYCMDPVHLEWIWLANATLALAFGVSIPGLWIIIRSTLDPLERNASSISSGLNTASNGRHHV
jgi:CDP-diacylglycerol--glycerol-3-phosphate 3-phosphatidyltransferase